MKWVFSKKAIITVAALFILVFSVVSQVFAAEEPNLDISYAWDIRNRLETQEIVDGGTYEIPVPTFARTEFHWNTRFIEASLYKGTLYNNPELLWTNGYNFFSPSEAVHQLFDYGEHFFVIYKEDEGKEWLEHGTSVDLDAEPPEAWGVIRFNVVPRAEREPNWDISYTWDGTEVVASGEYDFPLSTFGETEFTWSFSDNPYGTRMVLYKGKYKEGAEQVFNTRTSFTNTFNSRNFFPEYGDYFLAIFSERTPNLDRAYEWLANGSSTGELSFPLYNWGIIPFEVVPEKEGNSSVAFIPGLQASRLFMTNEHGLEDRLWEPSTDTDGVNLFMSKTGQSVNDVYVKGVVNEGLGVVNVYKSFIEEMNSLVDEGEITEWRALPYDWRRDVFDVATGDIKLSEGRVYEMVTQIEDLAQNSDSGKVTLITHSNGGLVAKALINKLEVQGRADLVDKLVLVAVPQVGTPKAIASILHGDYQEKGFSAFKFLTQETARELGKNLPGGYGLLPSAGYFSKVTDPVVVFDEDSTTTSIQRAVYGTSEITSAGKLDEFMIGAPEGRETPERDDLLSPIVANDFLLSNARSGQGILDNWSPPEGIEVTEIVGWGRNTLKGVQYQDKEVVKCFGSEFKCEREIVMDHIPLFTRDGDETVVSASADFSSVGKSYFLNLQNVNSGFRVPRGHASILEVDSILELLNSVIKNEEVDSLPQFITETKPNISEAGESLRLSVHSPVSIGVTDGSGNFTGIVDESDLVEISEDIPNSFYLPFGDGKYVGVPVGESYEVKLLGEDTGVFTLSIEEVSGDSVTNTESFVNIPVSVQTSASIDIDSNGSVGELSLDVNGDGVSDVALGPGEEFSPTDYVAVLRAMIENSDINKGIQKSLLARLSNIENNLRRPNAGNSADALLESMSESLQNESADDIIEVINILRAVLSD